MIFTPNFVVDKCNDNEICVHGHCRNSNTTNEGFVCICDPDWTGTNCSACKYLSKEQNISLFSSKLLNPNEH